MAGNKFATRLHRNTNRITMILIYAVLEWILICLLLLNSLFSYLIIKFAEHVGLQPPCLWCSRIDHILEPKKKKNMHKDLLCEAHSKEVSLLGYCSNHQKLTESQDLCEDCLSSKPEFGGVSKSVSFLGMIQSNGEERIVESGLDSNCSCCGIIFEKNKMVSDIVIKPSWDVLEYAKREKGELISEVDDDDQVEKGVQFHDKNRSDEIGKMVSYVYEVLHTLKEENSVEEKDEDEGKEEEIVEENQGYMILKKDQGVQVASTIEDDTCLELLPQHLEFFIDCSGHRLVPVELVDSSVTEENHNEVEEEVPEDDQEKYNLLIEEKKDDGGDAEHSVNNNGELNSTEFLLVEIEEQEDYSLLFHAKECSEKEDVSDFTSELNQSSTQESERNVVVPIAAEEEEKQHSDAHPGYVIDEDNGQIHMNQSEIDADVSIGTEIPDLDNVTDEVIQTQDTEDEEDDDEENEDEDEEEEKEDTHTQEYPSTGPVNPEAYIHGSFQAEEQTMEYNSLSVEVNDNAARMLSLSMELSEVEDDRVPDTPTSVDSLHHLHKKLLLLGEDSLDGSITSDFEGMVAEGGVITSEHLKSAIKAERKALHAIYSELEEERNASEIAANQTLAMINRLQEEKAAMQMEALQYQRMMEEQAEYDQEAMQLLNELMVKREKEKEELEKELDVYRKKVLEYETKEKLRMLRRMNKDSSGRNGFSSPSYSNAEESDAASIDLNQEVKEEEDSFYSHHQRDSDNENTPVGAVLNLEDSIADFEGERLSILGQLKVLEEKLMTLDDDEEYLHDFEDIASPTVHHGESNGNDAFNENGQFEDLENGHSTNGLLTKENGHGVENGNGVNGFLPKENVNGKYHPLKSHIIGPMGKSLLPLFDATSDDNGDIMLSNGNGLHDSDNGVDNSSHSLSTFEEGSKRRSAVEDELDHLYERLQALEADREFLKHCVSSLNKGDKGMHLLHEILHHLRDLRHVDLHVRNLTDSSMK